MKQVASAGFGFVGIISLVAAVTIGVAIIIQNMSSGAVSRESNPADIITDAQNTIDKAIEAGAGAETDDSIR